MRATFTYVPSTGATTCTVSARLPPLARVKEGHVTTPPASDPPLVASTKTAPAGSESRSATDEVEDGPALVLVRT